MYRADNQTMVRGYSQKIIKGNFNQTSTETGFYGAVIKNDSAFKIKPETERAEISKNNVFCSKGLENVVSTNEMKLSMRLSNGASTKPLEKDNSRVLMESTPTA